MVLNVVVVQERVSKKLDELVGDVKETGKMFDVLLNEFNSTDSLEEVNSVILSDSTVFGRFPEVVLVRENVKKVKVPIDVSPSLYGTDTVLDALKGFSVVGVDTSEILPSVHMFPSFLLVNVGVQGIRYGSSLHVEDSVPFIYTSADLKREARKGGYRITSTWSVESKRWKCQFNVLRDICNRFSDPVFVLFDESFSLGYLGARSVDERRAVVESFVEVMKCFRDLRVVPVGVFYTRSSALCASLIRGLFCKDKSCCKDCVVEARSKGELNKLPCEEMLMKDSTLIDRFVDFGWRSMVFQVLNRVTREHDLEVYGFYLKVGGGNVLRVEFPSWALRWVEQIGIVVLGQACLGGGYPYVLERAHEQAYISYSERNWVYEYVSKLLREKYGLDLKISRKELRKRRGIV